MGNTLSLQLQFSLFKCTKVIKIVLITYLFYFTAI